MTGFVLVGDTSGQIAAISDAASSFFGVFTHGWLDNRGRV